jgi:hypothetical protein
MSTTTMTSQGPSNRARFARRIVCVCVCVHHPARVHQLCCVPALLSCVLSWPKPYIHTYIRCIYGIFGRGITIHTVIYGAHMRFWPTLVVLSQGWLTFGLLLCVAVMAWGWKHGWTSWVEAAFCSSYYTLLSLIGLARTIHIRCIYGIFGWEITKCTVIYGVYIQSWPTLVIN